MNRMEHLLLDQQNSSGYLQQQGMPSVLQGMSSALQGCSSYLPQCYPYQTIVEREPGPFEIKVQKCGNQIRMDYGAELRILMADPFKGIDLREAVQKLKEALERI